MKFVLVAALLCLGAFQSGIALPHDANRDLKDLISVVEKAIEKLIQETKEAVQNAIEYLKNLIGNISEEVGPIIHKIEETVDKLITQGKQKIEELIEAAQKAGVDVQDCIADETDMFLKLKEDIINALTSCINKEIDTVKKLIDSDTAILNDIVDHIIGYRDSFKNCKNEGINTLKCLGKLAVEVAQTEKDLPGKIVKMIADATQFVGGLPARLQMCATAEAIDATNKIAAATTQVVKCISDKMSDAQDGVIFGQEFS